MKYLKYFESNEIKQQPFSLSGDYLCISDEIARQLVRTPEEIRQHLIKCEPRWIEHTINETEDFFNNTRRETSPNGYGGYKVNRLSTKYQVGWGQGYGMNLSISRCNVKNNEFGHFQYEIIGNSGDHDMHHTNMIRATRECNLNLMIKLYPIVEHIKNFYKRLRLEGFFDIIKDSILKNNSLVLYGVPQEFEGEFDYLISAFKYNL